MRLQWRPPIPGGGDPELIWGSVLAASALIADFWLNLGLPMPRCPLHAATGIPCPTCGTTRSVAALLHGEVGRAIILNPLMTALLLGAALYVCYAAVVVLGRLPRLRWTEPNRSEARWIRISVIALIAANWAYLIWRGL